MSDKFDGIKVLVKKINPASTETKEAIDRFLQFYSELYDKR